MGVAVGALALLVACGGPTETDGSVDAATDSAVGDAASDSGGGPIVVPLAPALPLRAADTVRLGPGDRIDVTTAFSVAADGAVTVVFDTFDEPFTRGELWLASSPDGTRFSFPRPLGFTSHAFEVSPSFVGEALYFAGADEPGTPPTMYLARVADPLPVNAVSGVDSLLSWPRWIQAGGSTVALAFRDGASVPRFAQGASPDTVGAPVEVDPEPGALATAAVFGDGTFAFTYQHPVGTEPMVSFVRRSSDGESWSDPVRVSDAAPNVHDTAMTPRADGGLDLYYIHPTPTSPGFVLFRRSLRADGALGEEQQLTAEDAADPSKPSALPLADGTILIAYANIAARSLTGEPTRQEITLTRVASEAP